MSQNYAEFFTYGRDDFPGDPSSADELLEIAGMAFASVQSSAAEAKSFATEKGFDQVSIYRISVEKVEG